uniref:Uncharacterized protein n=1 Tax=Arundo donax TaxID=35708 RepID=A0A0A9EWU7_ARUDO
MLLSGNYLTSAPYHKLTLSIRSTDLPHWKGLNASGPHQATSCSI